MRFARLLTKRTHRNENIALDETLRKETMFSQKKPTHIEAEIDRLMFTLGEIDMDSEEYGTILDRLSRLHKMKIEDKSSPVSKDTLVLAATNILGILLIIRHEHVNVISSKAMSMAQRLR